jgi:hypothetical protein
MTPDIPSFNVDALFAGLGRALFYGARASQLLQYTSEIVDLPYSREAYPWMNDHDRALSAERIIRQAVAVIGGLSGDALAAMLCLSPGWWVARLLIVVVSLRACFTGSHARFAGAGIKKTSSTIWLS